MSITLALHQSRRQAEIGKRLFHQWLTPDGLVWASFHRIGPSYLIRFPGLADFEVSADGREAKGFPLDGVSEHTVQHLYLNQVRPLALSRQMRLVLHGSAVESEASAIAFLGRSGRGKSTLAANFATRGYRFITDDAVLLSESKTGDYLVEPGHPSIRLWDDSRHALLPAAAAAPAIDYTPKLRLLAGAEAPFCPEPRLLRRIYVLGDESDVLRISPIRGRDALIETVRNCFLLDIEEHIVLKHHYEQLLALTSRVPFFRLEYPRRFERLDEVRLGIAAHSQLN